VRMFRVMSALLVIASVAAPCVAGDSATGTPPAFASPHRSLTALSARSTALLRAGGTTAGQSAAPTESGRFFKSKKGAAVIGLLAAGFGFTLYSKFHDDIKSPIREE
jgi:hypothetical protein